MKKVLLLLSILSLYLLPMQAQEYDKVWALGSSVTTMSFEADSIALGYLEDSTTLSFETIGSTCDRNGKFLFYSNGINIRNRYGHIMPNGDSLSYPSRFYAQQLPQGEASRQGVIILPDPSDTNQYYIFHYTSTDTIISQGGYEATNLYYSIVNMERDSGRGDLVAKNVKILQGEVLSASRLSACRHANGRDWWIVKPAWHQNIYYKFLLTPNGIRGPFVQQIGPLYGLQTELPAYSAFSPTGNKYASVTAVSHIVIMDFDRCSGLFSNPDSLYNNDSDDPIHNPISGGNSLAFSPNGRFLYVDIPPELNQYDLWSNHIHDSIRIETDTSEFFKMNILQLGPNGKIYISTFNGGTYKIHVINQPDSLGIACNFQLLGQQVYSANGVSLPYFPNFRLGALPGSCDTISTDIQAITDAHPPFAILSPNPANDRTNIIYYSGSNTSNQASMYDVSGRLVWSTDVTGSNGNIAIHLSDFATGMYVVKLTADGHVLINSKLVIAR